jgi:hypothetical protein
MPDKAAGGSRFRLPLRFSNGRAAGCPLNFASAFSVSSNSANVAAEQRDRYVGQKRQQA